MIDGDDILTSPNVLEEALNDVNARIPYQFVHTSLLFCCEGVLMIGSIEPPHQRMQVHIFFDISSIVLLQKQGYCNRRMWGLHTNVQAFLEMGPWRRYFLAGWGGVTTEMSKNKCCSNLYHSCVSKVNYSPCLWKGADLSKGRLKSFFTRNRCLHYKLTAVWVSQLAAAKAEWCKLS